MNIPIEEKVQKLNYCCVYGMVLKTSNQTNEQLAEHLDVDPRTISRMKKKVLTGGYLCQRLELIEILPHTGVCIFSP